MSRKQLAMSIFPTPTRTLRLLRTLLTITTLWFLFVSVAAIVGLQLSPQSEDQHGAGVLGHVGTYAAGWVQTSPATHDGVTMSPQSTGVDTSGDHQLLRLTSASTKDVVLSRVDDALPALLALAISALFLQITRSAGMNPFVRANVRRIHWLAGLFALYPIAVFIGNFANQAVFNAYVDREVLNQVNGGVVAVMFARPASLWAWGIALGLLALAQVFASGVDNREELETFV